MTNPDSVAPEAPGRGNVLQATADSSHTRLKVLDGWRAVSLLLVLAGHLLPLGRSSWEINAQTAALGMAIFFTLSGFLIVSILARDPNIGRFIVRRLARIVPLAWTVAIIILAVTGASTVFWTANLLFYANNPPFFLLPQIAHFWSLGVEMQFYAAIALSVLLLGRRGLYVVPIASIAITTVRVMLHEPISIVTWLRVDEILAGGTLALILQNGAAVRIKNGLEKMPFWPLAILFALSTRTELPFLCYLRPYLSAAMVGVTIMRPIGGLSPLLRSRPMAFVADISYAVYVFHPLTTLGWLGSGQGVGKYMKRPLSFALSFAGAYLSTRFFERPINRWAHRLTGPAQRRDKVANC